MARHNGTNWDMANRREKGGPRRKRHREYSRHDVRSPHAWPPQTTKSDLKRMLEEAAKNTAGLSRVSVI